MSRVVLRCQSCRRSVFDSFVALAGLSIPTQSPRASRPQPRLLSVPGRRDYAKTSFLRQTNLQSAAGSTDEPPEEAEAPDTSPSEPPTSTTSDSIPWYLQVSTPTPPAPISPLLALQEIPELPPNPPSLLEPLLEHLSVQIGLDNLSLVDLRHLHPPPALGANLLMIIGTARSVKHLNVSADRFCRWLRTEWRLRPYADGLLGRNELKLKLRRKARRQKMMGLVGARETTTEDDGITTGWVCVNVGIVDEHLQPRPKPVEGEMELEGQETEAVATRWQVADASQEEYTNTETEKGLEQHHESEDDYAGFGSRTTSPRIVVQMFTEDKRLEMDLEGLWDDRSSRRTRTGEKRDLRAAENLKMKGLVLEGTENDVEEGLMREVWEPKHQSRNVRSEPQGRKDVKSRKKAVNIWGD